MGLAVRSSPLQDIPNRNVFLFGAGVSAGASIPMLNGFVDRMIDIALRRRTRLGNLDDIDEAVFAEVRSVRDSIDVYHGRAAFNDRNIEDLLSILALAANSGRARERAQLDALVRAIARTIDLECTIPVSPLSQANQPVAQQDYGAFWRHVIDRAVVSDEVPTIVSLNYDLVLERALVGTIAGNTWNPYDRPLPFTSVRLSYHCATAPDRVLAVEGARFWGEGRDFHGYVLRQDEPKPGRQLQITLLKPHGSLNFPRRKIAAPPFQEAVGEPLLMPPVFNKTGEKALTQVWQHAMDCLRSSVNVVICGYSLPRTDMYMQYFLKAALGPNRDLSRILVFDPILHRGGEQAAELKERFASVFSEQIRGRIEFEPNFGGSNAYLGTFGSLVHALGNHTSDVLFL